MSDGTVVAIRRRGVRVQMAQPGIPAYNSYTLYRASDNSLVCILTVRKMQGDLVNMNWPDGFQPNPPVQPGDYVVANAD
jgi:hypothetical protein